jgi:hypothetical protein
MRYWVFRDSRILGPFSREDLALEPGVGPSTLVCPESGSGSSPSDWTSLSSVPELEGGSSVAVAEAPPGDEFESFRREADASLDALGYPEGWTQTFFDDPSLEGLLPSFLAPESEGLFRFDSERSSELESRLCRLKDELEEKERALAEQGREIARKDQALAEFKRLIERAQGPSHLVEAPLHRPAALPGSSRKEGDEPRSGPPAPVLEAALPAPSPLPAPPIPEEKESGLVFPEMGPGPSHPGGLAQAPFEVPPPSFGAAEPAPEPSQAQADDSPPHPGQPSMADFVAEPVPLQPGLGLPPPLEFEAPLSEGEAPGPGEPAGQAPQGFPADIEPLPADFLMPPPAGEFLDTPQADRTPEPFEHPKTMRYGGLPPSAPEAISLGPAEAPSSGSVGIPGLEGVPGFPAEQAAAAPPFPGAQPVSDLTPFPGGDSGPVETAPLPSTFDELFAASRTPTSRASTRPLGPPKTGDSLQEKPRRQAKTFLLVLGASAAVLVLVSIFFLRNPKEMKMMLDMGPQKKGSGQEALPAPAPGRPAAAPGPAGPGGEGLSQKPAEPEKPRDFVKNEGIQALDMVKTHVLDKERGTIAQWMQYSFPGYEDEWVSAALQAEVFVVTYNVFPGGRSNPRIQPISYRFEANIAQGTIKGSNPAAMDLLNQRSSPYPGAARERSDAGRISSPAPAGPMEAREPAVEQRGFPPKAAAPKPPRPAKPAVRSPGAVRSVSRPRLKAAKPKPVSRPYESDQLPLPSDEELASGRSRSASSFHNPGADEVNLSP